MSGTGKRGAKILWKAVLMAFSSKTETAKKIWQEILFPDFCPIFSDSRGLCSPNKLQLSLWTLRCSSQSNRNSKPSESHPSPISPITWKLQFYFHQYISNEHPCSWRKCQSKPGITVCTREAHFIDALYMAHQSRVERLII